MKRSGKSAWYSTPCLKKSSILVGFVFVHALFPIQVDYGSWISKRKMVKKFSIMVIEDWIFYTIYKKIEMFFKWKLQYSALYKNCHAKEAKGVQVG